MPCKSKKGSNYSTVLFRNRVKKVPCKSRFTCIRFGRTETPVKGLKQSTKRKETEYSL
jgi:hypothetical protein